MLLAAIDTESLLCHLKLASGIAEGEEAQDHADGKNRLLAHLLESGDVHRLGVL